MFWTSVIALIHGWRATIQRSEPGTLRLGLKEIHGNQNECTSDAPRIGLLKFLGHTAVGDKDDVLTRHLHSDFGIPQ